MNDKKMIIAKARGFTESIDRVGDDNKTKGASPQMAEDYNSLIALVHNKFPQIKGYLPTAASIRYVQDGNKTMISSEITFIEIHVYCNQIIQMLSEDINI